MVERQKIQTGKAGLNGSRKYFPPASPGGAHPPAKAEGSSLRGLQFRHGRAAIYATWDPDGRIRDYVLFHLEELAKVADFIIFVADNYYCQEELAKIKPYVAHYLCARHGESDFGSYKRGIEIAFKYNLQQKCQEIILVNASVYGPVYPYERIFSRMAKKDCDFWGITDSYVAQRHLQSYFICFRAPVIRHPAFPAFFERVGGAKSYKDVVASYEIALTPYFCDLGFKCEALLDFRQTWPQAWAMGKFFDPTCQPVDNLANGSPFLRRKAVFEPYTHNMAGLKAAMRTLRQSSPKLYKIALAELKPKSQVAFSVIMPAWNRAETIRGAIDSLLAQTWRNFELIISDDGSTDGTEALLRQKYEAQIADGKIRYIRNDKNQGVSHARNLALACARNEWIAYLDSDNLLKPAFLETYAEAIKAHPEAKTFYSNVEYMRRDFTLGKPFDHATLVNGENFIDMGGFVHHRDLYAELGGFDEQLYRLVDYDLIIRYTGRYTPFYIKSAQMLYNDGDLERITNSVNLSQAGRMMRHKHNGAPYVATILLPGADGRISRRSLDSAASQLGNFAHELFICALNGETPADYPLPRQHPAARARRLAFAELAACISACGAQYAAFLESGCYWPNPERLRRQLSFLLLHEDFEAVAGFGHEDEDSFSGLMVTSQALLQSLAASGNLKEALLSLRWRVKSGAILRGPQMALMRESLPLAMQAATNFRNEANA